MRLYVDCPYCGSLCYSYESWATGDWVARYECGTVRDDNGDDVRGLECVKRARKRVGGSECQ